MARHGNRRTSGRGFSGLLITLALHGGLFAAIAVANSKEQPPLVINRDFVVAEMVKLGKPRDKFWLPRITQPQRSTAPPDARQGRRGSQRQGRAQGGAAPRRPDDLEGPQARPRSRAQARAARRARGARRGLAHGLEARHVEPRDGRRLPGAGRGPAAARTTTARRASTSTRSTAPARDRVPHRGPTARSPTCASRSRRATASSTTPAWPPRSSRARSRLRPPGIPWYEGRSAKSDAGPAPRGVLASLVRRSPRRRARAERATRIFPPCASRARASSCSRWACRAPRATRAARPPRRCRRTWTSRACSRCSTRARSRRRCRARGSASRRRCGRRWARRRS